MPHAQKPTAAQINQRHVAPLAAAPPPTPQERPQGAAWSLRDIMDTREMVIESVRTAAFVPEKCKAMIIEAIETTHPKARLLRVDAHCQIVKTAKGKKTVVVMDISDL